MNLHELKPHPKAKHRIKRVGRGQGSGIGKTAGRGHKGQKQRGPGPRPGFEGGQMPLIRTMPKRGFTAFSKRTYKILNLNQLENLAKDGHVEVLRKVLGYGEVKAALKVRCLAFSATAAEKIKKAGGSCEKITESKKNKIASDATK